MVHVATQFEKPQSFMFNAVYMMTAYSQFMHVNKGTNITDNLILLCFELLSTKPI